MKITIKHKNGADTVRLPQRFSRPPPPLHLQSMDETALFSGYKSQRTKGHKKRRRPGGERKNQERQKKRNPENRDKKKSHEHGEKRRPRTKTERGDFFRLKTVTQGSIISN
uniref:Uncharacterized protein n=1 Tax=Populus trichocarpa TaxID=3694 RepID=A0A3N7G3Z2_POPTR